MSENTNTTALVAAIRSQVRLDKRAGALYGAYVAEMNVTRETLTEHAKVLASAAFPSKDGSEPKQRKDGKRTDYGNAVQAARKGLLTALEPDDADGDDKPDNILSAFGFKSLSDADDDAIMAAVRAELARRRK